MMARIEMNTPKDWQARMDLDTLLQASKIRNDPARMKAVKAMAQKNKAEKVEELTAVSGIAEGHKE
jgi:cell division septal protein FtsQ